MLLSILLTAAARTNRKIRWRSVNKQRTKTKWRCKTWVLNWKLFISHPFRRWGAEVFIAEWFHFRLSCFGFPLNHTNFSSLSITILMCGFSFRFVWKNFMRLSIFTSNSTTFNTMRNKGNILATRFTHTWTLVIVGICKKAALIPENNIKCIILENIVPKKILTFRNC